MSTEDISPLCTIFDQLINFLPSHDLLNCRLVCKSLDKQIQGVLTKVKFPDVKIDPTHGRVIKFYDSEWQEEKYSDSLKYVRLSGKIGNFNFPNLIFCEIETYELSDGQVSSQNIQLLNSLAHSVNLKELKITSKSYLSPLLSSTVAKLSKLQRLDLSIMTPFALVLSNHRQLEYFRCKRGTSGVHLAVYLDEVYEFASYETACKLKLGERGKANPIELDIDTKADFHFKYPLQDTLTRVEFSNADGWLDFSMPRLKECKINLEENDGEVIQAICSSICHSQSLQVFTLNCKPNAKINSDEMLFLLNCLVKLPLLRKLDGVIYQLEYNEIFHPDVQLIEFPSLRLVERIWWLIPPDSVE